MEYLRCSKRAGSESERLEACAAEREAAAVAEALALDAVESARRLASCILAASSWRSSSATIDL